MCVSHCPAVGRHPWHIGPLDTQYVNLVGLSIEAVTTVCL